MLFPVFYHPLCLCSTYSLVSFLLKHLLLAEKARLNALGHPEEKLWIHSAWLKESHSSSQVKYLLLLTAKGNWSYQNIPALFCFSSFGGLADVEKASLLFSFWRVPTLGQELGCWSLLSLGQFPFHNRDLQAPPQTQHLECLLILPDPLEIHLFCVSQWFWSSQWMYLSFLWYLCCFPLAVIWSPSQCVFPSSLGYVLHQTQLGSPESWI